MKICRETPNLVKIVQKYRAPHIEAQVRFIVTAVTCISTTHAELIVALPLQQWSCQHATVLCYT